ncbi:hypothetical protein M0R45_019748 [Rubus argutus]|uniref:Uncharacterized protein n=1 Tax=Rubus argutus TaxID=59490 RepID=A0AAW1X6B0_RUBAR
MTGKVGLNFVHCSGTLTCLTLVSVEANTESTGVPRKAESEYKGDRILLMCTRNLLSTMQHQDVIDRLQRQVRAAFKAGMVGKELVPGAVGNGVNQAPVYEDPVNKVEVPLERLMQDELRNSIFSMIVYVLAFSMFQSTST